MPPLLIIPPASKAAVWDTLAARVLARDGFRCVYCGAQSALEVDHLTPCAHFPANAPSSVVNASRNLVTACDPCNGSKGPQDLAGFARMLRGRGVPPEDVGALLTRVRAAIRRRLPRHPLL